MSKGSRQRPRYVDRVTFESNWDKIFGKQVKNEKEKNSRSYENQNGQGTPKALKSHAITGTVKQG